VVGVGEFGGAGFDGKIDLEQLADELGELFGAPVGGLGAELGHLPGRELGRSG